MRHMFYFQRWCRPHNHNARLLCCKRAISHYGTARNTKEQNGTKRNIKAYCGTEWNIREQKGTLGHDKEH